MVSVVVPAYNAEKTIERCIRSVLECARGQAECIVVNDGSRDGTSEVVDRLMPQFPGLIKVDVPNGGVARARNIGIERCTGEWVLFLDSDDTLVPEWFSLYQKYVEDSEADVHIFDYLNISPNCSQFQNGFSIAPGDPIENEYIYRMMLTSPELNSSCAKFYRWKLLEEHHITFPEGIKFGEDAIFVQRYCMAAERFALHPEAVMCYYYNPMGAMRSGAMIQRLNDAVKSLQHRITCAEQLELNGWKSEIYQYYFRALTSMMTDVSKTEDRKSRNQAYSQLRSHAYTGMILNAVEFGKLSRMKQMEYILLTRFFRLSTVYFRLKAKLRKENSY